MCEEPNPAECFNWKEKLSSFKLKLLQLRNSPFIEIEKNIFQSDIVLKKKKFCNLKSYHFILQILFLLFHFDFYYALYSHFSPLQQSHQCD